MAVIIAEDIKTGEKKNVTIADGAALTEVQTALEEQGMRLVPSTQVMVMGEDGKTPVPYPYPADMPAQKIIDDLAKKGWTLASPRGATPDAPMTRAPQAEVAGEVGREALVQGAAELGQDIANLPARVGMTDDAYLDRVIAQARERKAYAERQNRRVSSLQAVGSDAYPNFVESLPRAATEGAAEFALTRNMRSSLGRIGTAGAVAGIGGTIDRADAELTDAMLAGGVPGASAGLALSAVAEFPGAVKRYAMKGMMEMLRGRGLVGVPNLDPFHMDVPSGGGESPSAIAGIDLLPQQAGNSDTLDRLYEATARTPGGPREQFEARQAAQTEALFGDIQNRLLPPSLTRGGLLRRDVATSAVSVARERYRELGTRLRDDASRRFRDNLWPAMVAADARRETGSGIITGGKPLISATEYLRTLRAMRTQAVESGVPNDRLVDIDGEIERLSRDGGWTLGGYQQRLMTEGEAAFGVPGDSWASRSQVFNPKALYAAMQRDLDRTANMAVDPRLPMGGAGAPNRQAYPGRGREFGGASGDFPGEGDALANLQAWQASGGAGAGPGFVGDVPGAPQGPQAPSAPRSTTAARNPMEFGDPSFDPYEAAYAAQDAALAARIQQGKDAGKVATSLRTARETFAKDMEDLAEVRASAMHRILGRDKNEGLTADEFKQEFFAMAPDAQLEMMRFLDEHLPSGANYLRGALFHSTVQAARGTRPVLPGGAANIDLGAYASVLGNLDHRTAAALIPNGNPVMARRVAAGLKTMETVFASMDASTLRGLVPQQLARLKSTAINSVLQNEGFLAALATGEIAPHWLERALYTEEGLKAIMRLAEPNPGRAATATALAAIVTNMASAEADYQEIKARAEIAAKAEEAANIQR